MTIWLPSDYSVTDGPRLPIVTASISAPVPELKICVAEAVAVGAAVVVAKNPAVSRRFWSSFK